jgi:peptidoglycan glycosyltransferase
VLALASSPAFDPAAIDREFAALRDDPASPLLNRATQAAYDPGSTFKLVTAAAALDLGLVDLARPFACTTAVDLGGQTVDCRNNNPPVPRPTYKQAFAWSSNRTFALTGLLLGFPGPINPWLDDHPPGPYPWTHEPIDASARALERYAGRFGFEQEIPFDLAVRPSHLKSAGTPWSIGLLASTAFGQGELSVTPLQMALAMAAVGNDGKLPRPYLVSALRSPRGGMTSLDKGGGWIGEVMSAATAQTLRDFLVEGVERGYASKAHLDGVQVGGKTGTAEVGPGQAPHAWFIGLAPADAPRLAIAVVFEHGGSGSDVATPAGREVLRVALDAYPP